MKALYRSVLIVAAAQSPGFSAPRIYLLDQVNPALVEQDWSDAKIGRDVDGKPIIMGGKTFSNGVGTHAKSKLELKLDGKAEEFTAAVGMSDDQKGTVAKAEFIIVGDGKPLWSSGPMTPGMQPKQAAVKLAGVRSLVLRVDDGGNGVDYDHANWADARITYNGNVPSAGGSAISFATDHLQFTYNVGKDGGLQFASISSRDGTWRAPFQGAAWPGESDAKYHDAPVSITQANGDSALNLVYESHASTTEGDGVEHVTIKLHDKVQPIRVDLHLRVYAHQDVIEQWAVVGNGMPAPVRVERLDSGYWRAPANSNTHLEWYDSRWGEEAARPQREKLAKGRRVLESHGGNRHIEGPVPAFVLSFGDFPDEEKTPCMIASLAWSGSARMSFDMDNNGALAVSAGASPAAWPVTLESGGTFTSPACVFALSANGKGTASRNLHQWMRGYGMRDGNRLRPIDNNSWEGCMFDITETTIIEMMKGSAELGIELYVLDDGWFGNGKDARTSDLSGLGDWQPNKAIFPSGMKTLADAAARNGMTFGLWFEPEMINPRSELFARHPEWVLKHPNRELKLQRNQAVLDLANPAVQEFMFHVVDDILVSAPGIRFVKWDCNSDINNPYSPFLAANRQGEMLHRYMAGYYGVLRKLVEKHPSVDFQACSSGGGRADYGAMRYSHTYWVSDNTNPMFRLGAQWNFSNFLAPMAATCHVTHSGSFKPKFRVDVSMMGQLGLEIDPRKSDPEFKAAAKTGIAAYKGVREIVQFGRQYRHRSPFESETPCLNYVSSDNSRALVLAYQTGAVSGTANANAPVSGLDPARIYQLTEINLPPGDDKPRLAAGTKTTATGREWMESGIPLSFSRRHDSAALTLEAVK